MLFLTDPIFFVIAKGRRTFSYEVLRAYTRLFQEVLHSEPLTPERIDSIMKLLLTTIRLEFIHLHVTETLTSDIVRKAYFEYALLLNVHVFVFCLRSTISNSKQPKTSFSL